MYPSEIAMRPMPQHHAKIHTPYRVAYREDQLQPVVVPQSMQTLQVPFCTMRELPQFGQVLPS